MATIWLQRQVTQTRTLLHKINMPTQHCWFLLHMIPICHCHIVCLNINTIPTAYFFKEIRLLKAENTHLSTIKHAHNINKLNSKKKKKKLSLYGNKSCQQQRKTEAWILTSVTYASVIGGPLIGLKRSPILLTTVLNTRRSAASLGRDTEGGGISSSTDSPEATWLRSYSAHVLYISIHN